MLIMPSILNWESQGRCRSIDKVFRTIDLVVILAIANVDLRPPQRCHMFKDRAQAGASSAMQNAQPINQCKGLLLASHMP